MPRLGLIALGDSITVGEGNMLCGLPARSWALWLAEALDLPFTSRAVNGAVIGDVLRDQLPAVRADYDVGVVYIGVNDVRGTGWDPVTYEAGLRTVAETLRDRAERLLFLTIPLDLGRPRAGAKVAGANDVIRSVARDAGAAVAELADLEGWTLVLPDAVHPTALGQLEIADRAARALGAPRTPSELAGGFTLGPRGRASYARTHLRLLARDVLRRRIEAARA
ncbi:MAG TPA: GDSL-type esterase/lipase family protein [Solirubrobacteraceae bacterium]